MRKSGISLQYVKAMPIPLKTSNAIVFDKGNSVVRNLARHIRNAFAHSQIKRKNGCFIMYDKSRRGINMFGKIDVDSMPGLLKAIKANFRVRKK